MGSRNFKEVPSILVAKLLCILEKIRFELGWDDSTENSWGWKTNFKMTEMLFWLGMNFFSFWWGRGQV